MEHYRSTLATAAIAAFGLVAAAHILHPGNYEMQPRPVRAPVAVAATAPAWIDPPAARQAVPTLQAASASADLTGPAAPSGVARILAPETVAALPSGAITTPPISGTMAPRAERVRKAAASPRRRMAQRGPRSREASLDRGRVGTPGPAQGTDSPPPRSRIDPIGDLMRGLGLGGEG